MKSNKAFTLIELLVVVLIIGILAAIAVPQYQMAVEKSRASEAFTLLKSLKQAYDVYYLSNPRENTPNIEDLDIDIPGEKISSKKIKGQYFTFILWGAPHARRDDAEGNFLYYLAYYYDQNSFYCILPERSTGYYNSKYVAICKSLGGVQSSGCYNAEEDDTDACFKLQ